MIPSYHFLCFQVWVHSTDISLLSILNAMFLSTCLSYCHSTICLEHTICLELLFHSVQRRSLLTIGQKPIYQEKIMEVKELYANKLASCDRVFLGRLYTCLFFPERELIRDHNNDCIKCQLGESIRFFYWGY